ncbi:MAG: hypothetical protein WBV89_19940, partial [Ilumatobacter sp.]
MRPLRVAGTVVAAMFLLVGASTVSARSDGAAPTSEEEESKDARDPDPPPPQTTDSLEAQLTSFGFPSRAFSSPVDAYGSAANWTCAYPNIRWGTHDAADLLKTSFGAAYYSGLTRDCGASFGAATSYHKMGLAIDLPFDTSNVTLKARGEALIDALLAPDAGGTPHAMLRRLGIVRMIWNTGSGNDRIWNAENASDRANGPDVSTWRQLSSRSHFDHLHLTLSLAGGNGQTSYWSGGPGLARFTDPDSTGAVSSIAVHQFRTGWTTITNVDLNGDGADELLYYNANTGFTRFINPNNTG